MHGLCDLRVLVGNVLDEVSDDISTYSCVMFGNLDKGVCGENGGKGKMKNEREKNRGWKETG